MDYTKYYHYPLTDGNEIEFCHIVRDARKGLWKSNYIISLNNCKINVFRKGEFSVIVGGQVYTPTCGDLCFLAPFESHYGQIPKDTFLDYYQFDITTDAFQSVPDGNRLLSWLCDRSQNTKVFARPVKTESECFFSVCSAVESALDEDNRPLAFAQIIRFLVYLEKTYRNGIQPEPTVLSRNTAWVLHYIDTHFSENISLSFLAEACHVSESWLSRSFRKEIGDTVHSYLMTQRLRHSVELLPTHTIAQIGFMCGFSDSSHYIARFKEYFGETPYRYIKSHLK